VVRFELGRLRAARDHLHGVTGEVDEQPLARDMHLAQVGFSR
jgi:hypothetical protein